MKKIFELEKVDPGNNNLRSSEDGEQEAIIEILSMMIENNSPLLKNVFNDLSHLIKTSHVKRIIPIILRQAEA